MKTVDVYFDYVSPFAYLASEVLPEFADRTGVSLSWKPIDLMQLSNYENGLPYSQVKRRYVAIDAASLRSLEIERTLRSGQYDGSLLSIFQPCATSMGKRRLRQRSAGGHHRRSRLRIDFPHLRRPVRAHRYPSQ